MKRIIVWIMALSAMAIAAVALLWQPSTPLQRLQQEVPVPIPKQDAAPAIQYPLPDVGTRGDTLPALDHSDAEMLAGLVHVQRKLGDLLYPQRIVRNIVVTIDNLPREEASVRVRPVKPVPGMFQTSVEHERLLIARTNAQRYRAYVQIFEAIDPDRLVALYLRFYPLFQQAYQELGYPTRHFNDRLVTVIDHLLTAPELDAPAELVQPRVLYEFADPALQQASAGHKVMLRMGAEHAKRVKTHLKKIRAYVVAASAQGRSPS